MKYYALYDDNGDLITFGMTTANKVAGEITEAEYDALMNEHLAKVEYARQVYSGEIAIDEVPEEYRAEVAAMVETMQQEPEETISEADEALAILRGEVSE